MCYDISFATSIRALADYFPELIIDPQIDLEFQQDHIQGTAVFGKHPIIFVDKTGSLRLKPMEWGVMEFWTKEVPNNKDFKIMKKRNGYLNARSERILADTKSYWYKIKNNRCLIPVSGIFEHRGITSWRNKLPYHIKPGGQPIFFLPGLYSVYDAVDKETGELTPHYTFTLITRKANTLMCSIHNSGDNPFRMPLFLPFEISKEFLQPDLSSERYAEILSYEMPSEALEYYTTFTIRTGKPHPLGLRKHERYDWPETPPPPLGTMNPEVALSE
jgi:putative SOS response-associated peptidase YedK